MTATRSGPRGRCCQSRGSDFAIELRKINKSFGPVHANRDIDLKVRRGSVHGIVGENGAGKSTLMSILYGFYHADSGEIRVNGTAQAITDSRHALALGIGMVHQHFMLVDNFTVLENVVLGAEDSAMLGPSLDRARDELDPSRQGIPASTSIPMPSSRTSRSAPSSASKSSRRSIAAPTC